jgi:peptidoglycan/xylan/chitin deacetylase (PgdA/CDA1 family)
MTLPPRLLGTCGAAAIAAALCIRPPFRLVRLFARGMPDVVFQVETKLRMVALSLDDGPDPQLTPRILDVLARHGAHATFFALGSRGQAHPDVLERIAAEGHELGNHGWDDTPSWRMGSSEVEASLRRTAAVLDNFGELRLFRPGSGWAPLRVRSIAQGLGYRCALGSVYPQDGAIQWPRYARWDILRRARPGAVIVLHEGRPDRGSVVGVLEDILAELRRRGYTVTTVSDLLDVGIAERPANPRCQ